MGVGVSVFGARACGPVAIRRLSSARAPRTDACAQMHAQARSLDDACAVGAQRTLSTRQAHTHAPPRTQAHSLDDARAVVAALRAPKPLGRAADALAAQTARQEGGAKVGAPRTGARREGACAPLRGARQNQSKPRDCVYKQHKHGSSSRVVLAGRELCVVGGSRDRLRAEGTTHEALGCLGRRPWRVCVVSGGRGGWRGTHGRAHH